MSLWILALPTHVEVEGNTVKIWTGDDGQAGIHLSFDPADGGPVKLSRFVAALVDGVTGGTGGRVSLKEEQ